MRYDVIAMGRCAVQSGRINPGVGVTSQVSMSREVLIQPRLAQSRGAAPGGLQNQVLAL